MSRQEAAIAIIGGTGLSEWEGLSNLTQESVTTRYGAPSSSIQFGECGGQRVVFIARHGRPHAIPPHAINYRANIQVLSDLGIERIIAVNAVGGINGDMLSPGHIVLPNQIIDYTYGRVSSYFHEQGDQLRHIDFTSPYCARLRENLSEMADTMAFAVSKSGVYGCTQGPRLETAAEISRLERDGCDIVGMTGMPEAALAKELGLSYASICLVVNPAAGKSDREITMDDIHQATQLGVERVQSLIQAFLGAC